MASLAALVSAPELAKPDGPSENDDLQPEASSLR